MKVVTLFSLALISVLSIGLSSCKNDKIDDTTPTTCDTTTSITYSTQIKPIFDSKCVGCHGSSSPADGIDLSTKDKLQSNYTKSIETIKNGSMPQGGPKLDANTIQLIETWSCQGFKN